MLITQCCGRSSNELLVIKEVADRTQFINPILLIDWSNLLLIEK